MNRPKFFLYVIAVFCLSAVVNIIRKIVFLPLKNKNYPITTELDDQESGDRKQIDLAKLVGAVFYSS